MMHIQDYEGIASALVRESNGDDVWQLVHVYRSYRRQADDTSTEITIEILRGWAGFIVVAVDQQGRRVKPGEPTWDLEAAIANADWSALQ